MPRAKRRREKRRRLRAFDGFSSKIAHLELGICPYGQRAEAPVGFLMSGGHFWPGHRVNELFPAPGESGEGAAAGKGK